MKPVTTTAGVEGDTNIANSTTPGERAQAGMEIDEEGYPRPMPDDGTEARAPAAPAEGGPEEGMRWSTKEWVAKVEAIYWNGLPTPPASPPQVAGLGGDSDIEDQGRTPSVNKTGAKGGRGADEIRLQLADDIARRILGEAVEDDVARWEFLRTRYRKVEGDILQGGVSHEAVVW